MQVKNEKKFWILLLVLLFGFARAYGDVDYDVRTEYTCVENRISCDLVISAPDGWKIPQAPTISVVSSDNLDGFLYDENQKLEQINDSTYKVTFQVKVSDLAKKKNLLQLIVECPMCNDICVISSKKIQVHFDYSPQDNAGDGFIWILLLGFLGGLILNVMPCVLPVVLMKLKSLFSAHRKSALLGSICGNYFSFFVLAIFLAILKTGGETIGWGMHLQNVWFLKVVAILLFGLTLHAFEIVNFLPSIQIEHEPRNVFLRNFVFSVIATVTAIPCTAPFLGTAAAFAIQGTILHMFLIFFAIATGFSFPYIIASALKTVQAYIAAGGKAISASAASITKAVNGASVTLVFLWIFWLLCNQLSSVAIVGYVLVFLLSALALSRARISKGYRIFVGLLLVALILAIPQKRQSLPPIEYQSIEQISKKISGEIANNRIVVLNISADWCISCKYNKMNLLNDLKNVVYMEADLTRKNDDLLKFIHAHGRVGIPFMMVYGPAAPAGILLSEIPTQNELLDAIEKAKNPHHGDPTSFGDGTHIPSKDSGILPIQH